MPSNRARGGRGRGGGRGAEPAPPAAAEPADGPADAAAVEPPVTPTEVFHFNSELLQQVQKQRATIEGHPAFETMHANDPLDMTQGGLQPPFSLELYQAAVQQGNSCQFGANFFWQSMAVDPLIAHIPIKSSRINRLADTRYAEPCPLPAVTLAVTRNFNPLENKGLCRRVSPAEPVFAVLAAIARDVEAANDNRIAEWQKYARTCTFVFKVLENNDDFVFHHAQLREDASIDFELVRMSSLARMVDVSVFYERTVREKGVRLSAQQLAVTYNGRLTLAESSEAITDSFIDQALTIHHRMVVRSPTVFGMLLQLDEEYGVKNPLDGITKIHILLVKFKNRLAWCFELLVDLFKNGGLSADQFSVRSLKGTGTAAIAKGLADVIYAKQDILQHLLQWISDQKVDMHIKQKLRTICSSVASFRCHCSCCWNQAAGQVDKSWKNGWSDAANLMVSLLETVVFSTTYDETILQHLKSKKSISYMFEVSPMDELLTEISEALAICPEQTEPEGAMDMTEA